MTKALVVRVAVCLALLTPAITSASPQQSAAPTASTWSVSFDPSGLESSAVRWVGYPSENSPAGLRHIGKDRRVLEAQAHFAKVTTSAEGTLVEMTNGRYSRTMSTGQRMSAPMRFGKLWLALDKNGDIISLTLQD
jgi:hypothetical protein